MTKHATIIASALYALALIQSSSAFSPTHHASQAAGRSVLATQQQKISNVEAGRSSGALCLSSEDESSSSSSSSSDVGEEISAALSETSAVAQTETPEPPKPDVPLDLPSPILLASSMVLAIASTGSVFELLGGSPQYGLAPTAAIALIGTPLCFFLFYAAIVKGNAETEADDQRFNDNNKSSSSGFF